jgi:hypothetical protein
VPDITHVDSAVGEFLVRRLDVRHDQRAAGNASA